MHVTVDRGDLDISVLSSERHDGRLRHWATGFRPVASRDDIAGLYLIGDIEVDLTDIRDDAFAVMTDTFREELSDSELGEPGEELTARLGDGVELSIIVFD